MNAAIAIDYRGTATTPVAHLDPERKLSFGQFQARTLPTALVLVFAFVTVGLYVYRGDIAGAIGLGAFIAFWIGGGFGFLIGGVLYGLQEEAADQH